MHDPTYRQALSFAWRHTFKHPFLWVYGLFAAILGQLGLFDLLSQLYWGVTHGVEVGALLTSNMRLAIDALRHLQSVAAPDSWLWLLWLVIFALGVMAFFIVAAVVSQGALIQSAAKSVARPESFQADAKAWHAGAGHFWRLFFLQILHKGFIFLSLLLAAGGALLTLVADSVGSRVLFLFLFLLAVAFALLVSFLVSYAAGYIVVEDYTLPDALHGSLRLFREHWLVSLEVATVVGFANLAMAMVVVAGFFLLLIPMSLFWFISALAASQGFFLVGMVLLVFLFACLLMLLSSLYTVFATTVWTYLFMKMHREGIKSRVLHWLRA